MSMHTIYIEASDEITTVIERLKRAEGKDVALVAPKGAILLQSIVNLKLAKKAAADADKKIVIITTDKIGRNLARQLGIPVVTHEKDAAEAFKGNLPDHDTEEGEDSNVIAGVRIHRYYDEDQPEETETSEVEPIIIPKKMMSEASPADAAAEPIVPLAATTAAVAAADSKASESDAEETTKETKTLAASKEEKEKTEPPIITPLTRRSIDTDADTEADEPGEEAGEPATAEEVSGERRANRRRRLLSFSLFLLFLLLLGAGLISYLFLPKTVVTLAVPATPLEKKLDFTATTTRTDISPDNTQLPAELLTGEATETQSFKATGTKQVGDAATGSATLYNYNSTTPQTLPAGSKIVASGKSFTTQADTTVPGYSQSVGGPRVPGSKAVNIIADAVGSDSNLDNATANDITGSGLNLSATVTTSGGTSQTVPIVTATDIANAKSALSDDLKNKSKTDLMNKVSGRDISFNEQNDSFTLNNFNASVAAGAQTDSGQVSGTGDFKRLIVDIPTLKKAAEALVKADEKPSTSLIIDSIDVDNFAPDPLLSQASVSVTVKGKESTIIPADTLTKDIAGKKESQARDLIEQSVPNSTLTFSYAPHWWPFKHLPYSPKYLKLDIKYE